MSLKMEQVRSDQPGFYPRAVSRFQYCGEPSANGRLRCTRKLDHDGPHAAHTEMGLEGAVNPQTGEPIEGKKLTEVIQVGTW